MFQPFKVIRVRFCQLTDIVRITNLTTKVYKFLHYYPRSLIWVPIESAYATSY